MCVSWQWPAWALWITVLPLLIHTGHWFGSLSPVIGAALYLVPTTLWAVVAATVASLETRHTYPGAMTPVTLGRRFGRIVPYLVINTGMLPHQFSAFGEGIFGPLHSEFERTPKAATVTTAMTGGRPGEDAHVAITVQRRAPTEQEPSATDLTTTAAPRLARHARSRGVKVRWPYVLTEAYFIGYQLSWAVVFAARGFVVCSIGAGYVALSIGFLGFFYGDHDGKVCFVVNRSRLAPRWRRRRDAGEPR
jgi:hypothetical protein